MNPYGAYLRIGAYVAIVAMIFFAGVKTSTHFWSARYDKLKASHALAIEEQRRRMLSRQERINEETQAREEDLLRQLEIQREGYALLKTKIDETPLVKERIVRVTEAGSCEPVDVIDWRAFGGLYDSTATPRQATEADASNSGDAGSETTSDSR